MSGAADAVDAADGADPAGAAREALRQRLLLRAIQRDIRPGALQGWMRDGAHFARGLAAYQANAGALAERALAAAFPTVAELVGAESFAALARAHWHGEPPVRGDIGCWGGALADFIARNAQLAAEPYLADVARLDWAVHESARAADDDAPSADLARLADTDPGALTLRLRAGTALVASPYPVVAIRHAHRTGDDTDATEQAFAAARAALAAGRGECALVARRGYAVQVRAVEPADARFIAALLDAQALADALTAAGAGFDFEAWFVAALRDGLVAAAERRHHVA